MNSKVTIELTAEQLYALIDLTFDKRRSILDGMDARNRVATEAEWDAHAKMKELTNVLRGDVV